MKDWQIYSSVDRHTKQLRYRARRNPIPKGQLRHGEKLDSTVRGDMPYRQMKQMLCRLASVAA